VSKKILLSGVVFCLVFISIPGIGATLETERLIFRDITGKMPPEMFERLCHKVDSTLTEVLKFWSAEPRTKESGTPGKAGGLLKP
jgi:hypothetical protein